MPRPEPSYLAIVLLLAASPVLAQGELGGAPSPEEQERQRICPELKEAAGRRREQLEALFFDLSPGALDDAAATRARALFDLTKEDDARLLAGQLEGPGPVRCLSGLQAVVKAHGPRGLLFLLERLAALPAAQRGRAIAVLAASDEREAWQALQALLADPTPVPNPKGAAQAPPGYVDMRVCDHALRALAQRLKPFPPPEGVEWRADPMLPVAVRDKRVAAARALAKDERVAQHLAARPSLHHALAADQDAQRRLAAALAALSTR